MFEDNYLLIFHSLLILLLVGKIYLMEQVLLKNTLLSLIVIYCIYQVI